MTDTAFFDRMFDLAGRLLQKFGTSATLRRVALSKPDASGKSTRTPTDFPGLGCQTEAQIVLEMMGPDVSKVFIYKGIGDPKEGDQFLWQAETWKVVKAKKVNPEGNRLMVSLIGCVPS